MVALGSVVEDTAAAEAAPYGLLSPAVTVIEDNTPHWGNGFDYESNDCLTSVSLRSVCNSSAAVTGITQEGDVRWRTYYPFFIDTEFSCSTMGRTPAEVREIAEDQIEACTQKAIEFEFWTGSLARAAADEGNGWDVEEDGDYPNRYLASESVVDVTPTPGTGVRVKHAQALLEGSLGRCGCGIRGTLHMPPEIASVVGPKNEGGSLVTPLGNRIVSGSGYTGSGPGDVDPGDGKFWIYATGPVTVRLGETFVVAESPNQTVDIAKNTTTYRAEKPAAVTWKSCCHFGVLVDLSLDFA